MSSSEQLPADCPPSIAQAVTDTIEASCTRSEVANDGSVQSGEQVCRWLTETVIVERWPTSGLAEIAMANQSAISAQLNGPIPMSAGLVGGDGTAIWTILERSPSWPAAMITHHPDAAAVAIGIGESLRKLHQLDVGIASELRLNGAHDWNHLADQVRVRLSSDDFDSDQIREPYNRYQPEQLLEMFENGRPTEEEMVVSHGSYTPANVLFNGGASAGFVGLSEMRVIDRHFDLAKMHLAVSEEFGPEAVFGLYDGYGQDPNLIAIDHYVFAHILLMS